MTLELRITQIQKSRVGIQVSRPNYQFHFDNYVCFHDCHGRPERPEEARKTKISPEASRIVPNQTLNPHSYQHMLGLLVKCEFLRHRKSPVGRDWSTRALKN